MNDTPKGYAGATLRVDLSNGRIERVPLSADDCRRFMGGRGMDAKTLFDECPASIGPEDADNRLCLSTGALTGLLGPTTGRVNVAGLSPLTGLYGNSNAGTNWGPELKYAGYDRIVVTGRASSLVYLYINNDTVELRDAAPIAGKGVFDSTQWLLDTCGEDFKVACAGPAAERGVRFGAVIFDLWDAAGRCGLGSVMAGKNLKAVAVRGTRGLEVARPERYMEVARDGWQAILDDPGFRSQEHSALGTAVVLSWGNAIGILPTRNFRESWFEGADKIGGEAFRDLYSVREAPIPGGRACMSCPNRCKRFGEITSGKYAGTRGNIEYEGIAAFGSKCGVDDLAAVFHAFMLANDYGVDCISCGNLIATFMELNEEGRLPDEIKNEVDLRFGDADAMVEAVHRIATRKGRLGELGAEGAGLAVQKIDPEAAGFTTCIKGMDTIAADPRVSKGFGFAYAVASRGSDHLRAHPVFEMINLPPSVGEALFGDGDAVKLTAYGGKVQMVRWHEDLGAVTDSLGSCRFMHASYYAQHPVPELLEEQGLRKGPVHSIKYHDWFSAATGIDLDYEGLLAAGARVVAVERAINLRRGVRRKDDTLPERFFRDPVPKGPAKGEVFHRERFEEMLDEYYEARGWEPEEGLFKAEKLKELDLDDVRAALEAEGLVA